MSLLQDLRFAIRLLVKDRWFTRRRRRRARARHRRQQHGLHAGERRADSRPAVRRPRSDHVARHARRAQPRSRRVVPRIPGLARRHPRLRRPGRVQPADDERQRRGAGAGAVRRAVHLGERVRADRRERPLIGRDFRPEDDRPGAPPVVLLGNGIWKNRYGSDPSVVGRTIKVNEHAGDGHRRDAGRIQVPDQGRSVDAARRTLPGSPIRSATRAISRSFGRLADGVTLAQAHVRAERRRHPARRTISRPPTRTSRRP